MAARACGLSRIKFHRRDAEAQRSSLQNDKNLRVSAVNKPLAMRLLITIISICFTLSALAQVPSVTGASTIKFTENNNIFYRSVNDVFSAIDVDLGTGVTGTLPVANGGTGAATFTNNRLLTGNGTSAIVDEANLTFDGTTLTITGKASMALTGSYSTSQNFYIANGTVTSTANSLTHYGMLVTPTFANDGTLTGNSYYAGNFATTISGSTSASNVAGLFGSATNSSVNASTLYGTYGRITENENTTSLSNRMAGRYEANFGGTGDFHTAYGFRGDINATSTGRWLTGYGGYARVINAKTAYGFETHITNNRGTANTQRGLRVQNEVSGSGVVVDNAYGIDLTHNEASSGVITTYYGLHSSTTPAATTNYFLYASGSSWRNYINGSLALGTNVTTAKLFVRGDGTTSGTYNLITEKSNGTDILLVRDDGVAAIGTTPVATEALLVRGSTSDNTAKAFVAERSSGTDVLGVQNDGKVSVNNAAYTEALTVNGNTQTDMLVLTNQTASTATGKVVYDNGGGGTFSGTLSLGDGTHALVMGPTLIERHVLDYLVDWTTGRKGAFWTVPARYNNYKISKAYISVTAVGSGAGDDELTIEIGGVGEGVQVITAGTHTLVMNDVINTDDVITFNITEISAVPAQGLHVSFELSKL